MGRLTPVIMAASSLSRNTIGPAMSSAGAHRGRGIWSRNGPSISGRPQYQADIGVITTVGLTLLTRMPWAPSSSADTRVMLSSAALDDPYEMWPFSATSAAWLETLTIAPPRPRRIIDRAAYFVPSE